jgi:hypothetical protein
MAEASGQIPAAKIWRHLFGHDVHCSRQLVGHLREHHMSKTGKVVMLQSQFIGLEEQDQLGQT